MADLKFDLDPSKYSNYLPSPAADPNLNTAKGFNLFFTNLVGSVITIAGMLLLGYFLYGAVQWLTSGGNSDKLEESKEIIRNALTGMMLVAITYFFVGLIGGVLGIQDVLSPSFPFLR